MLNSDDLRRARRHLSDRYGSTFAEKASPELCATLGLEVRVAGTLWDFASVNSKADNTETSAGAQNVVIEMTTLAPQVSAIRERLATLNSGEARLRVEKAVDRLREENPRTPREIARLIRDMEIIAYRSRFLREAATVIAEVERATVALSLATGVTHVTDVCWLNGTVRTRVTPESIAGVAEDPNITKIDVPRRLKLHLNVSGKAIGAPQCRKRLNRTGRDVIVGVLDGEIFDAHPAFGDRVKQKGNFSVERFGTPHVHGTAVAGIIGGNGGGNIIGIAPDVTIFGYKIQPTYPGVSSDDTMGSMALQLALEDGVDIANCSWGTGFAGPVKSREAIACETAWALGMTIVKSAGNAGNSASTLTIPSEAEEIIVVGAVDRNGKSIQKYSSRGPLPSGRTPHLLLAPGGRFADGIRSCALSGGFIECGSGTSFAAAHVSGVLALILESDYALDPGALRDRLLSLCKQLPNVPVEAQGAGMLCLDALM